MTVRRRGASWRVAMSAAMAAVIVLGATPKSEGASAAGEWLSGWPSGPAGAGIHALAIGPTSARGVYAATTSGVYRTTDSGRSWSAIPGTPKEIAAIAFAESATIYTYSWGSQVEDRGFSRSINGGEHWRDPSGGGATAALGSVTSLAVHPEKPQVVIAGSGNAPGTGKRIYRSTDGGMNWQEVYRIKPESDVAGGLRLIVASTISPGVFYAIYDLGQDAAVVKSADEGQTWEALAGVCGGEPRATPAAVALDPSNADNLLVGCQLPGGAGVRVARSATGGRTWEAFGQGLPQRSATVQKLLIDPANRQVVFAALGGENGGVYVSHDGGGSWKPLDSPAFPPLQEARALALDPLTRVLFVGADSGVWQRRLVQGVDVKFAEYYAGHDGFRVLGTPLSELTTVQGWACQYFEKGRLEDHTGEFMDANWRFMFGLVVDQLQSARVSLPVGGDNSTMRYSDLNLLSLPERRVTPPEGLVKGTTTFPDGSVFVPYSADLAAAPGHRVPAYFWAYINRLELFPGGWLHDLGLPMTEAVPAVVEKGPVKDRRITVQAFQRAVLTYDPLNPADWQVERANVGTDYLKGIGR